MDEEQKINGLYERFLQLARYMLSEEIIAKAIADDAIFTVRKKYKKLPPNQDIIEWAMNIFDEKLQEQLILEEAKQGSEKAENIYFTKLRARLLASAHSANKSKFQNIEDIIQETLLTVIKRYKTLKIPLIPWSQKVLKDISRKYELRRKKMRTLTNHLSNEDSQQQKLEIESSSESDPLELSHYNILKERLLKITKQLSADDKKMLNILFSGGGRQEMLESFPNINENSIDTRLNRFRNRIKKELKNMGITIA